MIRCLAIDDEPLALQQIAGYIQKTSFLELVAAYPGAIPAWERIQNDEIDLLFVDINMPDISGLDFVNSLPHKPIIIFTTAYAEYALEGFKADALDYLLKPFGYQEFLKSSAKALRQYELLQRETLPIYEDKYLFVRADYKIQRIELDQILYIEGRSEYSRIYIEDDKPVMPLISLKSLEERLPSAQFMRIHRSYIVNLSKVKEVARNRIVFGDTYLPVGDQYKEKFNQFLNTNSI